MSEKATIRKEGGMVSDGCRKLNYVDLEAVILP